MSAQGALPDGRGDFGLIETLLWTPQKGFALAVRHRTRMAASAAELGFVFREEDFDGALAQASAGASAPLRVRLELRRDGGLALAAAPYVAAPAEKIWRAAVAPTRLDSRAPLLRHKTTLRALYENTLAASGADEVIFLNERDEICEGARTNIFVPRDGILLTPPVTCGLLPGVLRAEFLAQGLAREAILRLDDLDGGFILGNALRGQFRASLSD